MKKQNKFTSLNIVELRAKLDSLVRESVAFKVSLDPSKITEASNVDNLRKDLKLVRRQIAILSSNSKVI